MKVERSMSKKIDILKLAISDSVKKFSKDYDRAISVLTLLEQNGLRIVKKSTKSKIQIKGYVKIIITNTSTDGDAQVTPLENRLVCPNAIVGTYVATP
jgi:hypothetical protein